MIRSTDPTITMALLLAVLLVYAGCAPAFPREALDSVNRNISFKDLKNEPEKYKGERVLLGGMILAAKNTKEGALIEVLQKPLDSDGKPLPTDETGGRFLVQSNVFLDTAVYHPGKRITVIAEVLGRKELPLDEITYSYPLCEIKNLHLWGPDTGPRFYFGVGVSHRL